jgi:phage N-6-adenine-methyltransferase
MLQMLKKTNTLRYQMGSNEWYTPHHIIERARKVMGDIDLDPASSLAANQVVKATKFYTEADDSLNQPWSGRVWCNPPYGHLAKPFSLRLLEEYQCKHVEQFMLLLNSNILQANWFGPLWKTSICILNGRLRFISPDGRNNNPTHGSILIYCGQHAKLLTKVFSEVGHVVKVQNHRR